MGTGELDPVPDHLTIVKLIGQYSVNGPPFKWVSTAGKVPLLV